MHCKQLEKCHSFHTLLQDEEMGRT